MRVKYAAWSVLLAIIAMSCTVLTASAEDVRVTPAAGSWPCTDLHNGLRIAFYATTYDGTRNPYYTFDLAKNCGTEADIHLRMRHRGYPNVPDTLTCIRPQQLIYFGFQNGMWNPTIHPNSMWSWTTSGSCDQEPAEPLMPPPSQFPDPPIPPPAAPCPQRIPDAPWCAAPVTATVTGKVEVWKNNAQTEKVGLSGARFELVYFDGAEWKAVTTEPGGQGDDVAGNLGEDGSYSIEFPYPSKYRLSGGEWWQGCRDPGDGVTFGSSYACRAWEIAIRVYPENVDGSIRVLPSEGDVAESTWDVHVGRFFEPTLPEIATSHGAMAYGATLNVLDRVGVENLGRVRIRLHEGDGVSQYLDHIREIKLYEHDVDSTLPEHELAHQVYHNLMVELPAAPNCRGHRFEMPSSPECAFGEGLAHVVAVAAENSSQDLPRGLLMMDPGFGYDLESCELVYVNTGERFSCDVFNLTSADAEGRVAGALFDLLDNSPVEQSEGFVDLAHYNLREHLLPAIRRFKPATYEQFWASWESSVGQRDIDAQTAFMNRQVYKQKRDAVSATSDEWTFVECSCLGKDAWRTRSGAAAYAQAAWDFSATIDPAKRYRIWVNNPHIADADRDSAAVYTLVSESGTQKSFTMDQRTNFGWTAINAGEPVSIGPADRLVLTSGSSPTKVLAADGLILEEVG